MSWDVFISKEEVKNLEEADIAPIGDKKLFIKDLNEIVPNIDFSDSSWGIYGDEECSIEFNVGEETIVPHIMLHIRGGGDHPMAIIQSICEKFDCYAMDGSTGEQMDFNETDNNSFKNWQNYRDKIIGKG